MSLVTTVLFATSSYEAAGRFEELVGDGYTRYERPYEIKPTEQDGPKYGPGEVYYHGFNHIDQELLDALRSEPWPPDTVLWIYEEICNGPEVWVGGIRVCDAPSGRGF